MIPPRTNSSAVQAVLVKDYDLALAPPLDGFIASASDIVDQVNNTATNRGFTLSSTTLELIERWLAAALYTISDQTFSSNNTEGASGSYRGTTESDVHNFYLRTAFALDYSGALRPLWLRQRAGGFSMGHRCDRNPPYCGPIPLGNQSSPGNSGAGYW